MSSMQQGNCSSTELGSVKATDCDHVRSDDNDGATELNTVNEKMFNQQKLSFSVDDRCVREEQDLDNNGQTSQQSKSLQQLPVWQNGSVLALGADMWNQDQEMLFFQDGLSDDVDTRSDEPYTCVNCATKQESDICSQCGCDNREPHPMLTWDDNEWNLLCQRSEEQASSSSQQDQQTQKPVAVIYHEDMLKHEDPETASDHPERPDRVRAILSTLLEGSLLHRCKPQQAREATPQELLDVHSHAVLNILKSYAQPQHPPHPHPFHNEFMYYNMQQRQLISRDTYVTQDTFRAAALSAGSGVQCVEAVLSGVCSSAFAINRPPGHHAESNTIQGFCPFNNAAVAARAALSRGSRRVVIFDWDVHHGNGTEQIFYNDDQVLYISIHRHDHGQFYPGTGHAHRVGQDDGEGYNVNVPWDSHGACNGDYIAVFRHIIVPVITEFDPDLVIVSAGFDAVEGDPIGQCHVTPECFGHMTYTLLGLGKPVVLLLEGGYNLQQTAKSVESCIRVLLGEKVPPLPNAQPTHVGQYAIKTVMDAQSKYWQSLAAQVSMFSNDVHGHVKALPPNMTSAPHTPVYVGGASHSGGGRQLGSEPPLDTSYQADTMPPKPSPLLPCNSMSGALPLQHDDMVTDSGDNSRINAQRQADQRDIVDVLHGSQGSQQIKESCGKGLAQQQQQHAALSLGPSDAEDESTWTIDEAVGYSGAAVVTVCTTKQLFMDAEPSNALGNGEAQGDDVFDGDQYRLQNDITGQLRTPHPYDGALPQGSPLPYDIAQIKTPHPYEKALYTPHPYESEGLQWTESAAQNECAMGDEQFGAEGGHQASKDIAGGQAS